MGITPSEQFTSLYIKQTTAKEIIMFFPINDAQYESVNNKWIVRLGHIETQGLPDNQFTDLQVLGYPKRGQIDPIRHDAYKDIFDKFNVRFVASKNFGPARRFGSLTFDCQPNGIVNVVFGESLIGEPNEVEKMPASTSQGRTRDLAIITGLAPFLMDLLENEGYLTYLKNKGLLSDTSTYQVEISLDFYIDRAGSVGFHKDSLDHTVFVGLMFNNQYPINGPEYRYDSERDDLHKGNLEGRLPKPVLDDITAFHELNNEEDMIYRSEIEERGWIVFADETINHSSPGKESRAILGDERVGLIEQLNVFVPDYLSVDEVTTIRNYINSFGDTVKIYPEDIMQQFNPQLTLQKEAYIGAAFVNLGKSGMSFVQINNCDPTQKGTQVRLVQTDPNDERVGCSTSLNQNPSKMTSDNSKLVRQNSNPDLTQRVRNQPAPDDTRRQFVRFWVQVLPKNI